MKISKYIYIIFIILTTGIAYSDEENLLKEDSFVFDGIDDIIVVPNNELLNPKSMTVSLDFKVNDSISLKSGNNKTRQFMLFKKNTLKHFNEGIAIYYNEEGNNVLATVSYVTRQQVFAWTPKGSINRVQWYSITVSADSNDVRIYLDTVLQKANPTGFSLNFDKDPLLIGGSNIILLEPEKYGGMFAGELKNICIYNKSITEIGEKYFFSKDSSLDTLLILKYNQNEQSGIIHDFSCQNNGVLLKGRPTKSEISEPDFVRIHPNPAKGRTEIIFKQAELSDVKITIRDLSGAEIKIVHQGPLKKGEHRISFYPDDMKSGFYICYIESNGEVKQSSFIIAN